MQFLPASLPISIRSLQLSTPFLNELCFMEIGRKSAPMERFGHLTQANWQGAPSCGSVQLF